MLIFQNVQSYDIYFTKSVFIKLQTYFQKVRYIKIHSSLYYEQNVIQFTYANSFTLTNYTSEELLECLSITKLACSLI